MMLGVWWLAAGLAAPDRSAPPPVVDAVPLEMAEPVVHEIGPGVTGWHVPVPGVRKIVVYLVFGHGKVELDGRESELSEAVGYLADVAGGPYKADALSLRADLHEVELSSWMGVHNGALKVVVPRDDLAVGLELLGAIADPRFPGADVRRYIRDQEIDLTVEAPASPERVANFALAHAWFAPDHPYSIRADLDALKRLRARDLRARWTEWTSGAAVTAIVVGDVAWDEVAAPLQAITSGWSSPTPSPVAPPEVPTPDRRVVAVDMPGQEQVVVRVRTAAPSEDDPQLLSMRMTHWALGGHFLSRLNRVLREERDYTYGARARYLYGPTWGTFTVSVAVAPQNLAETVEVVRDQFEGISERGPTAEELDGARRAAIQQWNEIRQTAQQAASTVLRVQERGWTLGALREQAEAFGQLQPKAVADVAKQWLGPDASRVWVFVGDRAKMEPELAEAGLQAEWVTAPDAVLGKL